MVKKKFSLFIDVLNEKADLVNGKVRIEQLTEMDYEPTNHSHTTVNGYTIESNVQVNAVFTGTVYAHSRQYCLLIHCIVYINRGKKI